jgi:isopenicillin N synthase-like dioxygenase
MARVTLRAAEKARLTMWLANDRRNYWQLTKRELAFLATEELGFTVTPSIAHAARLASVPKPGPEPAPRAPWWRRLLDSLACTDALES